MAGLACCDRGTLRCPTVGGKRHAPQTAGGSAFEFWAMQQPHLEGDVSVARQQILKMLLSRGKQNQNQQYQ